MNKVLLPLVVVVVLVLGAIFILRPQKSLPPGDESTRNEQIGYEDTPNETVVVEIEANKGVFTPQIFQIHLFDTLVLHVHAVDKDYSFSVTDYPRLDKQFPKGETTTLTIENLGVGEYNFTCGGTCNGKIIVEPKQDNETGEENED